MPRLEIKHENTIMYKIVCNDLNITDLYVGQTTNFSVRKDCHKKHCCKDIYKQHNFKVYQYIRANGGWYNWSMVEIEKFTCNDSNEAHKRERYWVETLKATLNCRIPSRTDSEYNLANKEQISEYKKMYALANKEQLAECRKIHYLANKEQIAKNQKNYREANRELILEQKKNYREANREQIAENQKIRYLENKERFRQKIDCPCGGKYTRASISLHSKTQKHIAYLENTQSPSLAI
jgi:hypothetical protein